MLIDKVKEEKGFAMLIVAGAITVFLLILGFGIDFGRVWIYRGELQNAADAASLAGAASAYVKMEVDGLGNIYSQSLLIDPFVAETESKNVFYKNTAQMNLDDGENTQLQSVNVQVSGNKVTVNTKLKIKMFLLQLAGYKYLTVTRSSTAECILSNH
jgi:Flp pilus assembly protein TadG